VFKGEAKRELNDDWDTAGQDLLLEEFQISSRLQTLSVFRVRVEQIQALAPQEVTEHGHDIGNERIKSTTLRSTLNLFRQHIKEASDQNIWDVERILAEDLIKTSEREIHMMEEKRKPGRPPKTKIPQASDNKKITSFFKSDS
jgi:hypothetical protein